MLMFHNTQIQISPCNASQVRFTLYLKNNNPNNNKRCSFNYRMRAIDTFCRVYEINDINRIQHIINLFNTLN